MAQSPNDMISGRTAANRSVRAARAPTRPTPPKGDGDDSGSARTPARKAPAKKTAAKKAS